MRQWRYIVSQQEHAVELSVCPELAVRRGREAIKFYISAFGARVLHQVGGTDDNPEVVAELAIGGTSFWVSDESPAHGNHSPESLGGCSARLLLRVEDPEAIQAGAVALGAIEIAAVRNAHGWLVGRIADPFGHHWEIGKPLGSWPSAGRTG
jgi:PhnB protein